ncbi:MAG TPA: DUF3303 family protein [Thermoanaerobaculia bacterium]|nr:DUF3303 family protein [Thermoanaerobaculia bacterium]
MVLEKFRNGDPVPVYRWFRDQGRLAPHDLRYIGSWVTADLAQCFQVMECDDPQSLDEWMARWDDVVELEVVPVMTSPEAFAAVEPRL